MATNADDVIEDDKQVTEEDLRSLKYPEDGVDEETQDDTTETDDETTDETDDTSDETAQSDDEATDETEVSEAFTKKFDNIQGETPEEYARNLEIAYQNSTAEALRLKGLAEAQQAKGVAEATTVADVIEEDNVADSPITDPTALYMKQKMDEEITAAYTAFSKDYPQVTEQTDYTKFTKTVAQLSRTIIDSEKRLAPPSELYSKAAVILGWEKANVVSEADKLKGVVKNTAASGKTTSSTKTAPASKVTEAMVAINRKMYPGKTDAEIRTELEGYV